MTARPVPMSEQPGPFVATLDGHSPKVFESWAAFEVWDAWVSMTTAGNVAVTVRPLADLVAERDALKSQAAALAGALDAVLPSYRMAMQMLGRSPEAFERSSEVAGAHAALESHRAGTK